MRPSGIVDERPLTVVVLLTALVFLVVLAGGPSQFMLLFQRTVEAAAGSIAEFAKHLRT